MSVGMALIKFDLMPIEDRLASNKAGHYVARDIEVAYITPVGGRHTAEKEITPEVLREWKTDPEYKYRYDAYMAWKEGAEPPINGTALRDWPPISPAQLMQLNNRNIRSIEELAELPDDALSSFGPGFRTLRDKAREWLRSSKDVGQVVAQLGILKERVEQLEADNKKKDARIEALLEEKTEPKRRKSA